MGLADGMAWERDYGALEKLGRHSAAEQEESQRQRILKMRDEQGLGIYEAKRVVETEDLIADIRAASGIEDIKAILLRIVK